MKLPVRADFDQNFTKFRMNFCGKCWNVDDLCLHLWNAKNG